MARVNIVFARMVDNHAQVMGAIPSAVEDITSSASSQSTTAKAGNNDGVRIVSNGGKVRVAVGAAPTVTSTTGWLVLDGQELILGHVAAGHKVAVIDAA